MDRLAKEYQKSIKLIMARIKQLQKVDDYLASRFSRDLRKSKYKLTPELITKRQLYENAKRKLEKRIRELIPLLHDIREVEAEIENYYNKKGWWRSEEYTCNTRHRVKRYVYLGPIYDETDVDECEGPATDQNSDK